MDRRVIIATGASSGIGHALALAAARNGFAVVAIARRAGRLTQLAQRIEGEGGRCATLALDVTASGAGERIVATALDAFGRIDVLVNNAGAGANGPLLEQTDAHVEAQLALHVGAPLRISRAALPWLERSHGAVVFVGSGLARVPLPSYGAYALAKAAIRAAAIQLRRELRARGVAVTYVDPGLVATEFHGAMGAQRDSRVPAVAPERVAQAILRGVARRAPMVAAVPWQTLGVVAMEMLAALADPLLARMRPEPAASAPSDPESLAPEPAPQAASQKAPSLDSALEPLARRMQRVNLPIEFVRSILVPGATLELNEVAMRWAGMPNKNERAAMREVFEALVQAGYLHDLGDDRFAVSATGLDASGAARP